MFSARLVAPGMAALFHVELLPVILENSEPAIDGRDPYWL